MKANIFYWIVISCFTFQLGAQNSDVDLFTDRADHIFATYVNDGAVDYSGLKNEGSWSELIITIAEISTDDLDNNQALAFYINTYNILVIDQVLQQYPIASVNEVPNFFTQKNIRVAGNKTSLNDLEKMVLKKYKDARLHFAFVCGAVSCPKLKGEAYRSGKLDAQLDQLTKDALANPRIYNQLGANIFISNIFSWYEKDFGVLKDYFNNYLERPIVIDNFKYQEYDWTLNDQNFSRNLSGNNSNRYVSSATVPKGGWEIKLFNNFYTQQTKDAQDENNNSRNTFFTSSLSALYGISSNLNVGLSARYRRVNTELGSSNFLHVFNSNDTGQLRTGFTAFGPQIRWAPSKNLGGFSIQSAYLFPLGDELAGGNGKPYIDWNGASWFNQFFYDQSLGDKFSLFTEVGFTLEDIGSDRNNRITIPGTIILSYFPIKNMTIYGLSNYAKFFQGQEGYFAQLGAGTKYQFTPKFELELLSTFFGSTDLSNSGGTAATYNLGLRFNL